MPLPRRQPRRPAPGRSTQRRVRRPKAPRSPLAGLVGLVLLTLVAAFFAWVSAEPLWLALGYGDRGTAVVSDCTGGGVRQRCVGEFTSTDGGFRVDEVAVLGVAPTQRHAGASVAARMVSPEGRGAFAGDRSTLHLRWMIGVLLALACGPAIALATGASRLDGRRARLGALALSLATPPLIVAGFLANALWGWGF